MNDYFQYNIFIWLYFGGIAHNAKSTTSVSKSSKGQCLPAAHPALRRLALWSVAAQL